MLNDFRIIRRSKDKFTPLDALDIFKETTDYIDLMHEYYLGGHCLLLEKFNYKSPDEISVFFDKYNKLITN